MRPGRIFASLLVVAGAFAAGWLWQQAGDLLPRDVVLHSEPAPRDPGPAVASPVAHAAEPAQPQAASEAAARADGAPTPPENAPADPTGDLAYYAFYPLSDVPHRVVRGWGVGPRSRLPGVVGATVVVAPGIDRASLTSLARDIREYHRSAEIVAVRVLDSLEAATYDRHADGGALLAESVVATIHRNDDLGIEVVEVRGEAIEEVAADDAGEPLEAEGADAASGDAGDAPTAPGPEASADASARLPRPPSAQESRGQAPG
jgi:hypothetical protein